MTKLVAILAMLLAGAQDGLPPDRKVGKAAFKVEAASNDGEEVKLSPLMVPTFEMERITGSGPLSDTIVQCDVYDRILSRDEATHTIIHITILKCGNNEYGVGQVDFVMEP